MGFFYLKKGENLISSGETQIETFTVEFPSNYTDAPIDYTLEFVDDNNISGSTTVSVPNCTCEVSAVTEETKDESTSTTSIVISSITPSHASEVTLNYQGGNVPFYIGYDYVTSYQKRSVSSDTCGNVEYGEWTTESTSGHGIVSTDFDCHKCFTLQEIEGQNVTLSGNTYTFPSDGTQSQIVTIARIVKNSVGDCSTVPQYNALELQDLGYGTDWLTIDTFNEPSGNYVITSGIISSNPTNNERTMRLHYYTSGSTESCPMDIIIRQTTSTTISCSSCFNIYSQPIGSDASTSFVKVATLARKSDTTDCSTMTLPTSCTRGSETWINECSAKTITNGVEIYAKYAANTSTSERYGSITMTDCDNLSISLVQNGKTSTNEYRMEVSGYLNGCDPDVQQTLDVKVVRKSDNVVVYIFDENDLGHSVEVTPTPTVNSGDTAAERTFSLFISGENFDGSGNTADDYNGTITQYVCYTNDKLTLNVYSRAESTGGQDKFQTTYVIRLDGVALESGKSLTNPHIVLNIGHGSLSCDGTETAASIEKKTLYVGDSLIAMSDYDGSRECQYGGQFYDLNWSGLFYSNETRSDGIQISAGNLTNIEI